MEKILVLVLIPQLGTDDYRARELAQKNLHDLLPIAAPYLLQARFHRDPEIAARSAKLCDQWAWQVAKQLRPTHWPNLPWIDSLPYDYPARYQTIEGYLGAVGCYVGDTHAGGGPPDWPKYRQATKLFIHKMLLEGKSVAEVREVLDDMVSHEKGWIKKHKYAFNFPKSMLDAAGE